MRFEYTKYDTPDSDGHRYVFASIAGSGSIGDIETVFEWCQEHFGSTGEKNNGELRWATSYSGARYWFSDDDDAYHFRMRWC